MANLTLVRRDSFLEHLKQGVKPETISALRHCSLNGYALFPDAVIRKAEDEIAQFESNKRTSQPGPGQGGLPVGIRNNYNKTSTRLTLLGGNRTKTTPSPLVQLERICQLGSLSMGVTDPVVVAEGVRLDEVPNLPRRPLSINDNYCILDPVPVALSMQFVEGVEDKNISVVAPCTFCNKYLKAVTKERCKSSIRTKERDKIYEKCFCCRSLCFCPYCFQCPQCPTCSAGRRSSASLLALLDMNPSVVSILRDGYVLPFKILPPLVRDPLIVSGYANPLKNLYLKEALRALPQKKAGKMVRVRTSLAFFNRLFIVPKPNQKWYPILDLSALNKFLAIKTFKMETRETIQIFFQQGQWVTLLDFSDAYFHIPIHKKSWKLLKFHFQNQLINLRCLLLF